MSTRHGRDLQGKGKTHMLQYEYLPNYLVPYPSYSPVCSSNPNFPHAAESNTLLETLQPLVVFTCGPQEQDNYIEPIN